MLELNMQKNAVSTLIANPELRSQFQTVVILSLQDQVQLLPATAQHHALETRQRLVVEETDSTCTGVVLQDPRLTLGLAFGLSVDAIRMPCPAVIDAVLLTLHSEGTTGRALTVGATVIGGSANMTVSNCVSECHVLGYDLAGLEYSGECCE